MSLGSGSRTFTRIILLNIIHRAKSRCLICYISSNFSNDDKREPNAIDHARAAALVGRAFESYLGVSQHRPYHIMPEGDQNPKPLNLRVASCGEGCQFLEKLR